MLGREFTESLRYKLLWERDEKKSILNAVVAFKSRGRTDGVESGRVGLRGTEGAILRDLGEYSGGTDCHMNYFDAGLLEYHERGW
jgi:hypothetical protein